MQQKESIYIPILVFALLMAERFLIHATTFNLITCVLGLIILSVRLRKRGLGMGALTYHRKESNQKKLWFYAVVVPLCSIALVLMAEEAVWLLTGHSGLFFDLAKDVHYTTMETSALSWVGYKHFLLWLLIGVGISAIRSLFLELNFRGFILSDYMAETAKIPGNFIQATVYMFVFALPPIFSLVRNFYILDKTPDRGLAYAIGAVCMVIYLFLGALRQGFIRIAYDNIWACVVGCFMLDYFTSAFQPVSYWPGTFGTFATVFRLFSVHIVAMLWTLPLIKQAKKDNETPEMIISTDQEIDTDRISEEVLREMQNRF